MRHANQKPPLSNSNKRRRARKEPVSVNKLVTTVKSRDSTTPFYSDPVADHSAIEEHLNVHREKEEW